MSDLVGNPEDRFSRVEAHMITLSYITSKMIIITSNSIIHNCFVAYFHDYNRKNQFLYFGNAEAWW